MTEGIESVGEAVTGGMIARAVEPHGGRDAAAAGAASGDGSACLNCGAALIGPHCHQCGQQAHVHRTISAFVHDISHSVLHFDGKIWRTLPLLAWRPGELTRRYVGGERARFVSPMALFLFSVFLMFAVVSAFGGPIALDGGETGTTAADRAEAQREFKQESAETRKELEKLRAERQRLLSEGKPIAGVDRQIRMAQAALALQERLFRQAMALANQEDRRDAEQAAREAAAEASADVAPKEAAPQAATPKSAAAPVKKDGGSVIGENGAIGIETGWPPLDSAIKKANDNPSLLFYKIQTNAYKFSWALIPISVPFVWLMFLHRRRYRRFRAYDHVVFVTYSIAFMSLGFIALTLLRPLGLGEWIAWLAITFVPPIHMYRQLRGAYSLSRWSALWRTAALLVFASIAASLFFALLVALGAFA